MSWYTPIAQGGGMGDYAPANPFVGEFNFGGQNWFLQDANPLQNSGLNTTSPVYKAFMPGSAGLTEGFFTLGPDGKPQMMHSDYNPNESWGSDFKKMAPVRGAAALGMGAEYFGLLGGATPNPSLAWASGGPIPGYGAAAPALGAAGGAAGSGLQVTNLPPGASSFAPISGPGAGAISEAALGAGSIPGAIGAGGSAAGGAASGAGSAAGGLLDWMKSNPSLALLGAGLLGGLADGSKVEDLYGGRKAALDRLSANKAPSSPWGRY